jgi:multiple sugar transport system permease protein/raffinose/stachyose/melibiose transport system permease protein
MSVRVNRDRIKKLATPWLFLIVPLSLYLLILAYPLLGSIVLSFTEWSGMGPPPTFVGVDNYTYLFSRGTITLAIKNNLIWMALFVPIPTFLGFLLAYFLSANNKINIILRGLFYVPMIISNAVMAIMWLHVYAPQHGLIAEVLKGLHLPPLGRSPLSHPDFTIVAVTIVGIWHWIGFPLIIYLAAIQDIPQDLIEAADLDGASAFYKVLHIVIPFIRHATTVVVALGTILSMKVFDLAYIMTGSYYKNDVMGTYIWRLAFEQYELGKASAVSVIEFLLISAVVIPYIRWQLRTGEIEI